MKIFHQKETVTSKIIGGSRGGARDAPPPPGPKFLYFHAVFGKNWPNNRLAPPPSGVGAPPRGNPGSATEDVNRSGDLKVTQSSGMCYDVT